MPDDEPRLGDILGAAGSPFEIDHAGKTWRVGHPTQKARDAFNKLVKADALREAQAADAEFPGLEAVTQFRRDVRHYSPGGKLWRERITDPRANVLYLLALLREHHPDAGVDDAEALVRDAAPLVAVALEEVTPRFFDLLAADREVPPEVAAALRTAAAAMRANRPAPVTPGTGSTGPSSP
jgi:hypothetical protein